jgi:hypothetical protein
MQINDTLSFSAPQLEATAHVFDFQLKAVRARVSALTTKPNLSHFLKASRNISNGVLTIKGSTEDLWRTLNPVKLADASHPDDVKGF